jgi:hypothetical protein
MVPVLIHAARFGPLYAPSTYGQGSPLPVATPQ